MWWQDNQHSRTYIGIWSQGRKYRTNCQQSPESNSLNPSSECYWLRNKHWQRFPAGVVPALLHPTDQKENPNLPRKIPHQLLTRAHLVSTSLMARFLKEKQGCPGPIGRSPSREIYMSSYMCNIQNCRTKDWQGFWNMSSRITVNIQNDLTHHV